MEFPFQTWCLKPGWLEKGGRKIRKSFQLRKSMNLLLMNLQRTASLGVMFANIARLLKLNVLQGQKLESLKTNGYYKVYKITTHSQLPMTIVVNYCD